MEERENKTERKREQKAISPLLRIPFLIPVSFEKRSVKTEDEFIYSLSSPFCRPRTLICPL